MFHPNQMLDPDLQALTSKLIDDERNLNEARPGGHEGDISDPQLVRTRCHKFPVNQIEGAHQSILHDRRPALGALAHAFLRVEDLVR